MDLYIIDNSTTEFINFKYLYIDLMIMGLSHRSEIHENMNCTRCKTDNLMSVDSDGNEIEPNDDKYSTEEGYQANQVADDIGRFAEIAGCLHKLKSSEKQVGICCQSSSTYGLIYVFATILSYMYFFFLYTARSPIWRGSWKMGSSFWPNDTAWCNSSIFSWWWGMIPAFTFNVQKWFFGSACFTFW